MTDDPLTILREAGIECPEVEGLRRMKPPGPENVTIGLFGRVKDDPNVYHRQKDAAILALARLAARYKWQRDEAIKQYTWVYGQRMEVIPATANAIAEEQADLDARWEEEKP